mmetsp:Transcript_34667/g.60958  ORF Transcript_34667/g.60958 Transcript_34667/m.60958 type:complete len:191 (-) Transcript_34667:982-1554(-)
MASKLLPRLRFNDKGEHLINVWPQVEKPIRFFTLGWAGYMYFLYWLDPATEIGKYRDTTMNIFGALGIAAILRFRKFTYKMSLLKGGEAVIIEKYPMFGFGHMNAYVVPINNISDLTIYGLKEWYNPWRIGRGFVKLKYSYSVMGYKLKNSAIFRLTEGADKEVFKLVAIGKHVTERSLAAIAKTKAKTL